MTTPKQRRFHYFARGAVCGGILGLCAGGIFVKGGMPDGVRLAIIAAGVLYVYISNLIWGRPEILLRDAEEQFRAASEKVLAESWAELQRRAKGITP